MEQAKYEDNLRAGVDRKNSVHRQRQRRQAKRAKKRAGRFFSNVVLLVLLGLVVVNSISVIMNYTKITELKTETDQIQGQIVIKESERDLLEAELEPYKKTSRIEEIAKLKLGLDYPRENQIVKIDLEEKTDPEAIVVEKEGLWDSILSAIRTGE